jgi:hypothetical protein
MFLILFKNSNIGLSSDNISVFRYTFLVMGMLTVFSSFIFTKLDKNAGANMSGKRVYKGEEKNKL